MGDLACAYPCARGTLDALTSPYRLTYHGAQATRVVRETRDEVLLEMLWQLPSADDGHQSAGARGYLSEFQGP